MRQKIHILLTLCCGLTLISVFYSCRGDELVVPTEYEILPVGENPEAKTIGMYLLNEGNMGSNKASLDFLDYRTGLYARNIFAEKNPHVVKELGDVGNDIQVYGNKLYIVVNCSHKVDVLDLLSGKKITQLDIPNCRYIRFRRGKGYVSSYVGPVSIDPQAPLGAVYRIDTASLLIEGRVMVGYQPEEMAIVDQYMYVANSGGYRAPNYDNTVSVVELEGFKQIKQIPVGINLHRIKKDRHGKLWVSSRGNYTDIPSNLYVMEKRGHSSNYVVTDTLNIACSNMVLKGDSLYLYSVEYNHATEKNTVSYGIIDIKSKRLVTKSFISDGTENGIETPYGIAIHPDNNDIFVTDAKNYLSSGQLHCFDTNGKRKWSVRTGDIPAHMVFIDKDIKNRR